MYRHNPQRPLQLDYLFVFVSQLVPQVAWHGLAVGSRSVHHAGLCTGVVSCGLHSSRRQLCRCHPQSTIDLRGEDDIDGTGTTAGVFRPFGRICVDILTSCWLRLCWIGDHLSEGLHSLPHACLVFSSLFCITLLSHLIFFSLSELWVDGFQRLSALVQGIAEFLESNCGRYKIYVCTSQIGALRRFDRGQW